MLRRLTSRIGRFYQATVLVEIVIIVATVIAVSMVDLTGLSTACVGGLGARALFYVLFAIEAVAVVQVIRFRASEADLNAFRTEVARLSGWAKGNASKLWAAVAVMIFAAIVLFGSYMLGHGKHALCGVGSAKRLVSDYWYLLAVNLGRTLCLIVAFFLVLLPGPWRERT